MWTIKKELRDRGQIVGSQRQVIGVVKCVKMAKRYKVSVMKLISQDFPCGSVVKNPPSNAWDARSVPGSGRSAGEVNGNPLKNSCLGNLMDRRAWWAMVLGVTKELDTTYQLTKNMMYNLVTKANNIYYIVYCIVYLKDAKWVGF